MSDADELRVVDAVWQLISEGLVAPGLDAASNKDLPFLHITGWGKKVLSDSEREVIPYDPVGYAAHLRTVCAGSLDPIVESYVVEAAAAFHKSSCYKATIVMLGVASERVINLLAEATANALPTPKAKEEFERNMLGRTIARVFDELAKRLEPKLPASLRERFQSTVRPCYEVIRVYRNESGHPKGVEVSREECYGNLLIFPHYLKAAYEIQAWLNANKLP